MDGEHTIHMYNSTNIHTRTPISRIRVRDKVLDCGSTVSGSRIWVQGFGFRSWILSPGVWGGGQVWVRVLGLVLVSGLQVDLGSETGLGFWVWFQNVVRVRF